MDPARRKALGRSNPKQGKLKRVKRTTSLLRRQSELPCQYIRVVAHICGSQRIRHGWRRIYGMRRECTWRTCGTTGWSVPFTTFPLYACVQLDAPQAVTPTEKSFRPSHRASVHGSILHDASYFATIEIKGPEDVIRAALDSCCDCQGPSPGAKRYVSATHP